jgi:hypothetical protein
VLTFTTLKYGLSPEKLIFSSQGALLGASVIRFMRIIVKVYLQKVCWKYFLSYNSVGYLTDISETHWLFLRAVEKLLKAIISFVISFCLFLRPHGTTRLGLDGLPRKFIFE